MMRMGGDEAAFKNDLWLCTSEKLSLKSFRLFLTGRSQDSEC